MTRHLVNSYQKRLREADETRLRVETLFNQKTLLERDVLAVYEGLFLRAVVGFEDLLEQVFFAVLEGRTISSRLGSKLEGSNATLRQCVLENRDYLDWLPIKRTVDRAQIYLKAARPFADIDDGEKSHLSQILIIRHAIAHSSTSAV